MKQDKDITKTLSNSVKIMITQYGNVAKELIDSALKYIPQDKKLEFLDEAERIVHKNLKPIERLIKWNIHQ